MPPDRGAFLELAGLGAVLIDLHLLRSDRLERPGVRFEGPGLGRLDGRRERRDGRVIVNAEGQAFEGIAPRGLGVPDRRLPVLDRWLAGRAGRSLRWEEIEEFRRIAAALRWTIEAQRPLRPPLRRGVPGVLGPGVPGVAPGELLADLAVGVLPEAPQVVGHLLGTAVTNQIASPLRPARPVRPMRCTYASVSLGMSKLTTWLMR